MPVELEKLTSCMDWAARRGLSEFVCEIDGTRVTIRRETAVAQGPQARGAAPPMANDRPAEGSGAEPEGIAAPMAGLCHLAPEEGAAPFVAVGEEVEAGQTLCVLEAMKMMTPIGAPSAGIVEEILVRGGETVEAGQTLMRLQ